MATTAAATGAGEGSDKPFWTRIDPRWYSSTLLTTILVVGQWRHQILGDSYLPWIVALGTAVLAEVLARRALGLAGANFLSAYISGNSVAILLKPQGDLLWPFVVCSLLSILSKHVLQWRGRHLWNPTNLGVCALLLLAPTQVSMLSHQWGNDLAFVALLWLVGGATTLRARVVHISLAWLAAFVAFAWLRSVVLPQGTFVGELMPITGPMYTLFLFFMVTDPKTTVRTKGGQMAVAVLVAAFECLVRFACELDLLAATNPLCVAPPMYALFLVGPAALAWSMRADPRAARGGSAPARA
jgi:Na+-translocating ferredoxin:NAD+ oxidoreductase RnfD subunit